MALVIRQHRHHPPERGTDPGGTHGEARADDAGHAGLLLHENGEQDRQMAEEQEPAEDGAERGEAARCIPIRPQTDDLAAFEGARKAMRPSRAPMTAPPPASITSRVHASSSGGTDVASTRRFRLPKAWRVS
jgi:hypothetical protein